MQKFKVALIQQKYFNTKLETISNTVKFIEEASQNGAKLIVLQELHQSEYFCQTEDSKFFNYASSWKDDIKFWSKVAQKCGVVLVTSLFEERTVGLYHNTAVVFDTNGEVAGKYRKMHIPDDPAFYEKFYFTEGDLGFEPIDTSLGRLGVLICWDQWYPEASRIMALKGAEILIFPTAIGWFDEDSSEEQGRQLESWITIQRSHAIANGIPVLSCNRIGFERDSSGVLNGIKFWGNSFICDPQGEILAQANSKDELILYGIIDKNRTQEVRNIWPFFRDRRIGSYYDITKRYCD